MTWNTAAAQRSTLTEIANAMEAVDADILALQEIDVGTTRSAGQNQPAELADALGYDFVFAEALPTEGGAYGLAVLSRLPFSSVRRLRLRPELSSEPRIAIDVSVCSDGAEIRLINTHIDYKSDAASDQLEGLGLVLGVLSGPVFLLGDLNATPDDSGLEALLVETEFVDLLESRDPGSTQGSRRIDYILGSETVDDRVIGAGHIDTAASDHRIVWVDVEGEAG
ncbi:MAG: endonuclease/exonuclease/phosphatase family protein [Nannocystaceae bacterium]|nr:endonuclease/exonuclease/phosphatase family protein [Nannocystaceae bacterium]